MASRKKSSRRRNTSKRLRLENLEKRELLAADFMQQNPIDPTDVDGDGVTAPSDALTLINAMNVEGPLPQESDGAARFMDVDNDGVLSPRDALAVINRLNRPRPEGVRQDSPGDNEAPKTPDNSEMEFASIDGTSNNLESDAWGSVGQTLQRWTAVEYSDGFSEPAGEGRLSAREISNIVVATPGDTENALGLSDLTWLFGQFIDHDIDLSESGDEAFDIEVATGDAWFDPFGTGEATIGLNRTDYIVGEEGVRQQFNEITAFIDGSVIYGSDLERADALRTFEDGLLATSEGELLPFNVEGLHNAGGDSDTLFLAGDVRANENAALTAMHTLWVREHNRVAAEIAESDPSLSDEEIYQLARQFVTAELQSITYNEFLPALLGEDAISEYAGYDATVNPNIANVFSTAAYRFGHSMLSSELLRLNNDGTVVDAGNLDLQEAFFNTSALTANGIESLLLGASVQTAQEVDPFIVDDVRNFLFGPPGAGGLDLASLNIQRGRDHGLADYNQIRVDMGLTAVESFADISSDPEIQRRLEEAYGDVDSIDAWVGMLAEDHVAGSTLGITATAIIAEQFTRLRDGDRFYYENVFTGRQLNQIENTTLADVIERNTSIQFNNNTSVFFASDDGITADDGGGRPNVGGGGSGDGPGGNGGPNAGGGLAGGNNGPGGGNGGGNGLDGGGGNGPNPGAPNGGPGGGFQVAQAAAPLDEAAIESHPDVAAMDQLFAAVDGGLDELGSSPLDDDEFLRPRRRR